MLTVIEIALYCFLLFCAILALRVRDLLASVIILSVFSFACALLFALLGAVDVGFTEAVVGAGITSIFFLVTVYLTTRKSED